MGSEVRIPSGTPESTAESLCFQGLSAFLIAKQICENCPTGKIEKRFIIAKPIDFLCACGINDRLYVQVTQEIKSEKTEKREYERLLEIRDNYPKYVLRTDEFAGGNYQGIKSMHIADFLLSAEY